MRIAVVNTHVPFTRGGAEMHADNLVEALRRHGHEVELVQIPFNWQNPWSVMDHLMATRLMDLERVNGKTIDQVIGLRFPAYHIRHPNKVLWIIHQYRSAFDFWEDPRADLAQQVGGRAVRDAIRASETQLLRETRRIYANSQNVQQRLEVFSQTESEVLYHPPGLADCLHPGESRPYFLCPGRIETLKRQDFVLEALGKCSQPIVMKFVGPVGSEKTFESLKKRARALRLENRIEWLGFVSKEALVELYAHAQAVVYAPQDEDYGYVSLEAQIAAKPVITTRDAGGVLEFVDAACGWVSDFEVEAFTDQLEQAWSDPDACKKRGGVGRDLYLSQNISWDSVVETLVP